ncbi:putative phosphatidylserine decarboxylase [Helianthus anomalus]
MIKRLVFGCSRSGKEGGWSNHAGGDKGGPPKVSQVRIKTCLLNIFRQEKKFLLERNGPHVAKVSVFENHLIGYCEVDLFDFLSRDSDSGIEVKLLDPMVKLATYIFHVLSRCITISYFHLVHR